MIIHKIKFSNYSSLNIIQKIYLKEHIINNVAVKHKCETQIILKLVK